MGGGFSLDTIRKGNTTMRTELIEAKDEAEATEAAPWAAVIVEAEGGYLAFESVHDAEVWANQS